MSTDADITSLPYFTQLPSIFFTSAYGKVVSASGATLLLSKETFSRYADNVSAYRETMPANGKLIPKGGSTVTSYERMIFPHKEMKQMIIPITSLDGLTVSPIPRHRVVV